MSPHFQLQSIVFASDEERIKAAFRLNVDDEWFILLDMIYHRCPELQKCTALSSPHKNQRSARILPSRFLHTFTLRAAKPTEFLTHHPLHASTKGLICNQKHPQDAHWVGGVLWSMYVTCGIQLDPS